MLALALIHLRPPAPAAGGGATALQASHRTGADIAGDPSASGEQVGIPLNATGLREVARFGGATRAVATAGDRMLVAVGTTVEAYALRAGPRGPAGDAQRVGPTIHLPGPVTELVAAGSWALAELDGAAVHGIDLRDPARPRVTPALLRAMSVWQRGSRMAVRPDGVAFLAAGRRWEAVDLADPSFPRLATVVVEDWLRGIALDGDRLLAVQVVPEVGSSQQVDGLLRAWDVADPRQPRPSGPAEGLRRDATFTLESVGGGRALLLDDDQLLFATTPAEGEWQVQEQRSVSGIAQAVVGPAGLTYVTREAEPRLEVIGAHGGATTFATSPDLGSAWPRSVRDLHVRGGHLFVALADHGVQRFDLTRPGSPRASGEPFAAHGGTVADVALDGTTAWIATAAGLTLLEVGGPGPPGVVGAMAMPRPALAVDAEGGRGVVATWRERVEPVGGAGALPGEWQAVHHVVDARGADGPRRSGTTYRDGIPRDVLIEGRYAWVAHRPGDVLILDLGEHHDTAPRAIARLTRGEWFATLSLSARQTWVTWHEPPGRPFGPPGAVFGLVGWPRTDPPRATFGTVFRRQLATIPGTQTGATRLPAFAPLPTVGVGPSKLAIMLDPEGIHVVRPNEDVGTGDHPIDRLASIDLPRPTLRDITFDPFLSLQRTAVDLHGSIAWIAAADAGLRGIDVSLPERPDEIAMLSGPTSIGAVAAAGPFVLAAAGEDGLLVLRWEGWRARGRLWLPCVGSPEG